MLEGKKFGDALFAQGFHQGGAMQGAVFGEIEAAPGIQHEPVHLGGQAQEGALPRGHDGKVKGQRVAVHGMGHQEVVGAVALEDAEVGNDPIGLGEFKLGGEDGLGVLLGDEALVLDQAAGLVGMFPVGHIIEQEGETCVGLRVDLAVPELGGAQVLGEVDSAHPWIIDEGLHEAPHEGLGHDAEKAVGQLLVLDAQGLGGLWVLAGCEVIRLVDLPAPQGVPVGKAVNPADEIVRLGQALLEDLKEVVEVLVSNGRDVQQARIDLFELQVKAGDDAEHAEAADGGMEQIGVLRTRADLGVARRGQDLELLNPVPNRAGFPVVLAVDVHRRRAAEGREHRPRHDVGPPAILNSILPELLKGNARLDADKAGLRVPGEDALHAGQVEGDALGVQGGVAVGAARTTQADGSTGSAGVVEDGADAVGGAGAVDIAEGCGGHPPPFHALQVIIWQVGYFGRVGCLMLSHCNIVVRYSDV